MNMAKQKKMPAKKQNDSVVYKSILDLAILCVGFFLLQIIGRNYDNPDRYEGWNLALQWTAIVSAVLFAAGLVLAIVKKDTLRKVGTVAAITFGILGLSALSLYIFWYLPIPFLYFFLVAGCVLYLITLLYPTDFSLIAILTTALGGLFYLHGQQGVASITTIVLYVVVAAALLATALLTMRAAKAGGKVTVRGKTLRLFAGKSGPLPLYLTCTICAVCSMACLIFGGTFAYYCTYAAAAGLFIAACYYTIRLD